MKTGTYHVAPGYSVKTGPNTEYSEGQTIENLPREQGDPRVKSGVLIRGPGPDKFEAEDGDPELELSGGSGSAPAKSTPSTPSPETDDGLPKSLKPKGEAREGNVEIREGIEIAKVDIIARAFADFDGTVKAWNAQSDEQISERLYTAGEALLAERHPELAEQDPETETDADPETETDDDPETETDADPETETDDDPETETDADPETETDDDPETETDADPETETDDDPETETDADPETETDDDPETDPPADDEE